MRIACGVQCFGTFALVIALAVSPPAKGAMLLIPLSVDAPVARLALEQGASLLSGSGDRIVVQGERRALWWPMLREGVLTIAAPRGGCGGSA